MFDYTTPEQRPLQPEAAGRCDVLAERRVAVPGLPDGQPGRSRSARATSTKNIAVPVDGRLHHRAGLQVRLRRCRTRLRRRCAARAGWTVVDNKGNGQVWQFNDPGNRGNLTGGSGKFAIVDSDCVRQRRLAGHVAGQPGGGPDRGHRPGDPVQPGLQPAQRRHRRRGPVSIDGGTTWTNVLPTGDRRPRRREEIAIPQAAGQSARTGSLPLLRRRRTTGGGCRQRADRQPGHL